MKSIIKIGTRGSALALYQTELVASQLKKVYPDVQFEFVRIRTQGDVDKRPLGQLDPGIFTREIENALLEEKIDLAVHSAKDLASELPKGLVIGAILKREDSRDCLVAAGGLKLNQLKSGSVVGTSSLRRKAQLRKLRPDFKFQDLRGNVDTRVRKIEHGELDAMVIAYAGLKRLGLEKKATDIFNSDEFLPQAGQGAIAIELKQNSELEKWLEPINHEPSAICVSAERKFLARLEGGCQVPAGINSVIEKNEIRMKAAVYSVDGEEQIVKMISGPLSKANELGVELADQLLKSGGEEILREIRNAK